MMRTAWATGDPKRSPIHSRMNPQPAATRSGGAGSDTPMVHSGSYTKAIIAACAASQPSKARASPMSRMGRSPAVRARCILRFTISSVSPKYRRTSQWPNITRRQPTSATGAAETCPVCAGSSPAENILRAEHDRAAC